jgi:hypothetical protein
VEPMGPSGGDVSPHVPRHPFLTLSSPQGGRVGVKWGGGWRGPQCRCQCWRVVDFPQGLSRDQEPTLDMNLMRDHGTRHARVPSPFTKVGKDSMPLVVPCPSVA